MGLKFKNSKRVSIPLQCRWCQQILVGGTWVQDRRTVYGGRYAKAVCPNCGAPYFLEPPSQDEAMKD